MVKGWRRRAGNQRLCGKRLSVEGRGSEPAEETRQAEMEKNYELSFEHTDKLDLESETK